MRPNKSTQWRLYADASFRKKKRSVKNSFTNAAGGIVLVGPDGKVHRAFLINYKGLDLKSSSAAEMTTMSLALEMFHENALSITGDSDSDVARLKEFVELKKKFSHASIIPSDVQQRLIALEGRLDNVTFIHKTRDNQYIQIADDLAGRAHTAKPGKLHEVRVVDGVISQKSLDKIAPLPFLPPEPPEN
ncbi:MAG: hypothetical protein LRZ85_08925 [Alphaproteobacteria bacterium]|nr:hypothetical protein [Alphaproteobacteria bacterium]MCD8520527.1 hypothetical protein [Alphaproteobacteria bacterium]MCD8570631.1 hypothetical protein [Alphaproteobacteria bacterium]